MMLDMTFNLSSILQTGQQVASLLKQGVPLLLYGEMGAGKTTLIKHIVKALGCSDEVTSPTFTIMQSYEIAQGILWHIDLYRLREDQIDELGLDELNMHNLMIIEWPERLGSKIFSKYIKGLLLVQSDSSRRLVLEIIQ